MGGYPGYLRIENGTKNSITDLSMIYQEVSIRDPKSTISRRALFLYNLVDSENELQPPPRKQLHH